MKKYAATMFSLLWLLWCILTSGCSFLNPKTPEETRREAIDHFGKGLKLEEEGKYLLAVEEFLQAEEISPRAAIYFHLGTCFLHLNEPDRATAYLERAVEMAPDYKEAKVELERARLGSRKMDRMIAAKSERSTPTPPPPLEIQTPTPTPIAEPTRQAPTPEPSPAEPVPAVAKPSAPAPAEQKIEPSAQPKTDELIPLPPIDTAKSKDEKKPASKPLPSMAEVQKSLFPNLYDGKSDDDVREDKAKTERYIERKKKSASNYDFHMDKARQYQDAKLYNTAILEYVDALKADPDSLDAISELAEMYRLTRRQERANRVFANAKINFPQNPKFFLKWGNLFLSMERLNEAEEKFREALYYSPNYPSAMNNLGIIEMRRKNYEQAVGYFESVLSQDSGFTSAHLNLGIIYSDHLKNRAKAIEHFEAYIKAGGERSDEVKKWLKALKP
ncbi:MAG TPA: tetratricopeptide repeat protein [Candidatus Sumerlaeia bacterium]|nr:tetratricopeptide repeat protein [Candidatus Sumerlaeia bacterium]